MLAVEARAERTLLERRRSLQRRYGWAGLELHSVADPRRRTVTLRGEAISARALAAAVAELRAALGPPWAVDARPVQLAAPRGWFALPTGVTRLWRAPRVSLGACSVEHALQDMEMCTELVRADGPVGVLAAVGGWTLVRASDGTLGWTAARLADAAPPPRPARPTGRSGEASQALARALRRLRGTPYRLGGTTPLGVDCSGLVQRAVRAAVGVVLPRHSGDQLALAAAPVRPLGEPGDLVFMWSAGESPCHVGVVLRGARAGERTLVHASSRRGRVIEEPLERALARAASVQHVEFEQVLALRR